LRDRAGEWRALREQLPPGPPLREDAQRLLWKIRNQQGSLTADYANAVFWSAHNARVSRKDRPDALQGLILQVLNNRPKATEAEVLEALRKHERQGVIETITDEVIEWTDKDGSAQETQISALKFRISRARKKLQLR
jgi:hypothetical protein